MTDRIRGSILGTVVKRVEDPRFVRGEGQFLDDLQEEGTLHLRSVRSPFAHGVINSVETTDALTMPGVVAVYTAADLELGPTLPAARIDRAASRPPLAADRVRFAGEVVAVVVAESLQAAVDGAGRIFPDIDPLPAVATMAAATAPDAPLLFEELGSNVVKEQAGPFDPDLFADADVVVEGTFWNQRLAPVPLEGNVALAVPAADGTVTLWVGTQNVFGHRARAARSNGMAREDIVVRSADQGGGFGAKFYAYPEQLIAVAVARRLGRPVKWVESRTENMLAMTHGRAQLHDVTIGARHDGTITAIRIHVDQDVGAYPVFGAVIPTLTGLMASGPYRIPKIEFSYRDIVTNTMSVDAYRGAGRPEAAALLERIVDMLAMELDIDPAELRRRNFYRPEDFPVTTPVDATYDTGEYEKALGLALEMAGYEDLRADQAARRARGDRVQLGIGLSSYVEVTAHDDGGEWGAADFDDAGKLTLRVGTAATGQGHETAFAQIAAEQFRIPLDDITVVFGDTGRVARGSGTGGSRSLQIGGSALYEAGEGVLVKARRIVAHLLEASEHDIVVMEGGRLGVAGVPDTGYTWAQLAAVAADPAQLPEDMEPGLGAETIFRQDGATYPFGTHVSVVEVDTETGDVTILRHIAVDDAGEILNPLLLDGQVHGGIAQGVGQARFEEMRYDEYGTPLTGNLVTYLLPLAPNLPSFEVAHTVTPTDLNPFGVKGIGEAATIGSTPAVHNAVIDALSPFGVKHLDMPLTANRIWEALRRAGP